MYAIYGWTGTLKNNQNTTLPLTINGNGRAGPINYSASANLLKTETKVSAQVNSEKIGGEIKAGIKLIETKASVSVGSISWNNTLSQGKAEIGGKAELNLKDISLGVGAKAGAYFLDWKNIIGVKIGGISVEIGGSLNAGVGGEFGVNVGKNGFNLKLGGTLGVGGSAVVDIRW